MNDLAEKALHAIVVARNHVSGRPVLMLSIGGFVASGTVVFAGGRIGAAPAALPLTSWFGLLAHAGYTVTNLIPGLLMIAGIAALAALWLVALSLARTLGERGVWTIATVWAVPFVIGPPLLSTDVYSYAAHGLLARAGLSPYHHAPSALAGQAIVNAIDPNWRSTPSTGGPLSTAIEHLLVEVSAGNPLGAVLLLRALAVVCAVAIGRLAADLAGRRRAAEAVAITALNPAMLLYVVSGAHFEGLFVALLLGALVRAGQRRWILAIVLACAAAGVKPIGLIAVVAILATHAIGHRPHIAWRTAARELALAVGALAVCALVVPYGLGWVGNLGSVTHERTRFAPANLVSDAISPIVPGASFDDLAAGGRVATVLAAVTAVCYLFVTMRNRPLDRTVGFALLAVGVLGPVLYPWFLLWGLPCIAATARRVWRDWVVALSVAACVLTPAGFATRTGTLVTGVGLAVVAAALAARLLARRRAESALAAR